MKRQTVYILQFAPASVTIKSNPEKGMRGGGAFWISNRHIERAKPIICPKHCQSQMNKTLIFLPTALEKSLFWQEPEFMGIWPFFFLESGYYSRSTKMTRFYALFIDWGLFFPILYSRRFVLRLPSGYRLTCFCTKHSMYQKFIGRGEGLLLGKSLNEKRGIGTINLIFVRCVSIAVWNIVKNTNCRPSCFILAKP